MKKILMTLATVCTMVATMAVCPLPVEAATLKTEDGIKYIQYDSGETKVYTGWTTKAGNRYYYKNGIMKKSCWLKVNGERKYFLRANGTAAVGKVTISGIEYEFDNKGKLLPDEWGITLTATDVTPTGINLNVSWDGTQTTGEIRFGEYYTLEQYINGKWETVSYKDGVGEVAFNDEAFIVSKNNTIELSKNWNHIYGELDEGKYRLSTQFMDFRQTGDYDTKIYYAYFTL